MQLSRLGLLLFLGLGTTVAVAQDAGTLPSDSSSSYTAKEMLQGASDALAEMGGSLQEVEKLLESAERNGDTEAVDCIVTRLNAIRALEGVSNRASSDLQEALAADQLSRGNHEYRKIEIALNKVRLFTNDAQSCTGDGSSADGITEVTGGDDASSGEDDTNGLGISDGVVGTDPPGTTPFE